MSKAIPRIELPTTSAQPADIYLAVGEALSWWEASEDILMGIFKELCSEREPTAFETFVASPRGRRGELLKAAMKRYATRFVDGEVVSVLNAMKALDKLSEIRNQIAHGHCSHMTVTEGGKTVSGNYLLPSLNEGQWHERSVRYAHTAETIGAFQKSVREHRGLIMDVYLAIVMRNQVVRSSLDGEENSVIAIAKQIAYGDIKPQDVLKYLRQSS